MPKKQADIESINEALQNLSNDWATMLKILNRMTDKINEVEEMVMKLDERVKELEGQLTDLFNDHSGIMEKLDKISKSLYWHRQTTEQNNKSYNKKQYRSYNKRTYRRGYRK